jgi:hypothetical protein
MRNLCQHSNALLVALVYEGHDAGQALISSQYLSYNCHATSAYATFIRIYPVLLKILPLTEPSNVISLNFHSSLLLSPNIVLKFVL